MPGWSPAAKRRLYGLLVDRLETCGAPKDCVLIWMHELPAENIAGRGGWAPRDVELGFPMDV